MTERSDETRNETEQTAATEGAPEEQTPEESLPELLQPVADAIIRAYPDLTPTAKKGDWLEVNVPAAAVPQFFSFLKETPELAFDYLSDLTAVDYEDDGFQIVYHLIAIGVKATNVHRKLVVKIDVPRDNPHLPTAVDVWPTANFHEREVYDMMGVIFEGHPDLRRILMREDWVGHPLRKDYVDERPPRPRIVKKS